MKNILNQFLLAGNKFIPEIHLRQPAFTNSVCGPLTKTQKKFEKI